MLHFRELEGKNAEIKLSSGVVGRPLVKITGVNAVGKILGELSAVKLKPFEVKFVEVEF